MTPERAWRLDARPIRLLSRALVVLAVMAANFVAVQPGWATHPAYVAVHIGMSGALATAGLSMAADPAQRGIGSLLVAAGLMEALPVLSWHDSGPYPWISWAFGPLALVPVGVVLLAYPAGRLRRRKERQWALAAALWLVVGRIGLGLFPPGDSVRGWWPVAFHSPTGRSVADAVFNIGGLALVVSFTMLLRQRWTQAGMLDRFVDAPVAVASLALGVTAAAHLTAFLTGGESRGAWPALVQDIALAAVPASFIAVAIARRLLYASLASALADLPTATTPADVEQALATSLHDPHLEVLYWVPDTNCYVDSTGAPASPPAGSLQRLEITSASGDGSPLAVIRVDASAHRHPELLASALRLGTLALENTRLQAALLARLQDVQQSRARIVEATLSERRRMERDLHDGAQQRLLAMASTLGRLHTKARDPEVREILDEARQDLRMALKDLRDLAHGIHPALLTEAGLGAALAGVAGGLPLPVQLTVADRRWPPNAEATAYFVACEALTNAAKHSGGSVARVAVSGDDSLLRLSISDDGDGGADMQGGSGLRGIQDRVAALGGTVTLTSPCGSGTRIEIELPCGQAP